MDTVFNASSWSRQKDRMMEIKEVQKMIFGAQGNESAEPCAGKANVSMVIKKSVVYLENIRDNLIAADTIATLGVR